MPRTWPSPPPPTDARPFLPEPDPAELAALIDELERIATVPDEDDDGEPVDRAFDHADALESVSVVVEMMLEDAPTIVGYAYLLAMCVYPMVPELIALQMAFGSGPVRRDLDDLCRLADRATRRGLTLDAYVAELHRDDAMPDTPTARLLRGESRRRPDEERMRRGIRILRHAASLGLPHEQANLFCTLGWLHWSLGQRAIAQSYLTAAIDRAPDHAIAWGLTVMVGAGRPEWLGRRVTPRGATAMMRA